MANKKISEFTINMSPSGDNLIPIVASGETQIITLSGLSGYINVSTVIYLDVEPSGATINIIPNARKTFVKINTPLTGDTFFTCSDLSTSVIGDTLIISTVTDITESISYIFDNNFFITSCGGSEGEFPGFDVRAARNMAIFTFDGELWVNTYDNC